jgi:hypothetical protein
MHVIITTESGAHYTWSVNDATVTRHSEPHSRLRASAWANVRLVGRPTVGESWEFTGWPGELRTYEGDDGVSRVIWSPWCAKGEDDVLSSSVADVTIVSDGVRVSVPTLDVLSISNKGSRLLPHTDRSYA